MCKQVRELVLLLVLGLPLSIQAGEREFIAVLDVVSEDGEISLAEAEFLTDQVRAAALEAMRERLDVMTRETMATLVPVAELQCFDEMCLAEIGGRLQARYITGGRVRRVGRRLALTVEMYDTMSRALLGTRSFLGEDVDDLVDEITSHAASLFRGWLPKQRESAVAHTPIGEPPSIVREQTFSETETKAESAWSSLGKPEELDKASEEDADVDQEELDEKQEERLAQRSDTRLIEDTPQIDIRPTPVVMSDEKHRTFASKALMGECFCVANMRILLA